MKSIENDRELGIASDNPFVTEIPLYNKERQSSDIIATVVVPDFYHVALPNLGHQMVEQQLNEIAGVYADRTYLAQDYSLLKEQPSAKPDIIFTSMSYEGSYIRSLRALDQFGIPLASEDRTDQDPLVVFGGWSISRNPMPLFPIADVIGIGDSEDIIRGIIAEYRAKQGSRQEMFEAMANIPGVIVPSLYKIAEQEGYLTQWEPHNAPEEIYPAHSTAVPHSWYLSPETDYNDIGYYDGKTFFSMEIVEACASKCAYCGSGYKDKARDIQDPNVVAELGQWAAQYGADLVKLFFPANSSVPATKEIMRQLMAQGLSPRVGSAKAEYIDQEYIELVGQSGQEKIAFAPETGDEQLRKRLGKPGMTNEVLRRVTRQSVAAGIPNLDYYFIMNLPHMKASSVDKTVQLIGELHNLAKAAGLQGRIRISAPNFFPKAGTPFQYAASGDLESYPETIDNLENALGDRIAISNMKGSVDLLSQNIMARGGTEAGYVMIDVYQQLKQREQAQGQYTPDTIADWRAAMAHVGVDEQLYFRERQSDQPLPWHHIHASSISTSALATVWRVYQDRVLLIPN